MWLVQCARADRIGRSWTLLLRHGNWSARGARGARCEFRNVLLPRWAFDFYASKHLFDVLVSLCHFNRCRRRRPIGQIWPLCGSVREDACFANLEHRFRAIVAVILT